MLCQLCLQSIPVLVKTTPFLTNVLCCPATSWLYGYPMARSTHYNPLVRWLRLYTGDHIILVPQLWLVAGYDALPWAFDHEKLNQASADLRSWVPHLFALAARPTTYLEFIWFLIVATGEIPFPVLLAGSVDSIWPHQVPMWILWSECAQKHLVWSCQRRNFMQKRAVMLRSDGLTTL